MINEAHPNNLSRRIQHSASFHSWADVRVWYKQCRRSLISLFAFRDNNIAQNPTDDRINERLWWQYSKWGTNCYYGLSHLGHRESFLPTFFFFFPLLSFSGWWHWDLKTGPYLWSLEGNLVLARNISFLQKLQESKSAQICVFPWKRFPQRPHIRTWKSFSSGIRPSKFP